MPRRYTSLRLLAASLLLAGCVVVPRTVHVYDPACRVLAKQMTLEAVQVAYIGGCGGDACIALLAAAGVTAGASAIVSGSIAVVGNVVYWLERQGACPDAAAPASSRPVPAPAPMPAPYPTRG